MNLTANRHPLSRSCDNWIPKVLPVSMVMFMRDMEYSVLPRRMRARPTPAGYSAYNAYCEDRSETPRAEPVRYLPRSSAGSTGDRGGHHYPTSFADQHGSAQRVGRGRSRWRSQTRSRQHRRVTPRRPDLRSGNQFPLQFARCRHDHGPHHNRGGTIERPRPGRRRRSRSGPRGSQPRTRGCPAERRPGPFSPRQPGRLSLPAFAQRSVLAGGLRASVASHADRRVLY
jgi:hypothetical protein